MQKPMDQSIVARADVDEAKRLLGTDGAVFVDVRPQEAYEQSHIPGAISMPLVEMPLRYGELPRDKLLILY